MGSKLQRGRRILMEASDNLSVTEVLVNLGEEEPKIL